MTGGVGISQTLDLWDRLRVLARFKWLIGLCVVVGLVGGYGWSTKQTKLYHGSALLLAQTLQSQTDVFNNFPQGAPSADVQDRNVATQIKILESPPIKAAVTAKIPNVPDVVGIQSGATNGFTAQVSSADPVLASQAATAYAQAYIDFQRNQSVADITAAAASVTTGVQALQKQLDDLQAQINQRIASNSAARQAPQNDPVIVSLQQQRQSLVTQQGVFQTKLNELNVNAQLKQSPAILVAPAKVPHTPYYPTPKRSAALAAVAMLFLGLGVAFLIDYLDDRVKTQVDVAVATESLAVLGTLPKVRGVHQRILVSIPALGPTSGLAEAFRSLRTNVQFLIAEGQVGSLLITSPAMGEGKTTVAGNLAITLGRAGQRIIILDADMRKPRLHTLFGLDGSRGLSSVLSGTAALADVIQEVPGEPNVRFIAAGPVPTNPSELLSSEWTKQLIGALQEQCDRVVIDTPPGLPVTDAIALSSRVDACILVAMAGKSKKRQLHRVVQNLRQVNAPVMGIVVNGIESGLGDGYGYGYGYSDRSAQSRPTKRKNRKAVEVKTGGRGREVFGDDGQ